MGRRERKKELTRGLILDAAAELFATRGYEATSVDDIVQSADVVKGTFYYHFRSKEDLVVELRSQTLLSDFGHIDTALAAGASPLRVIIELFAKDAEWTEKNIEMARVFFSQLFGGIHNTSAPETLAPESGIADRLIGVIAAAQSAGELRQDLSPAELADMLIGILGHAQVTWMLGPRSDSLVERVRNWILIALQGLDGKSQIASLETLTAKQ